MHLTRRYWGLNVERLLLFKCADHWAIVIDYMWQQEARNKLQKAAICEKNVFIIRDENLTLRNA